MKREFQTQQIITLLLIYLPQIHLLETTVKFKLNHTKNERDGKIYLAAGT